MYKLDYDLLEKFTSFGAKAHRTEIEIYAEPENIAGSVDLSVMSQTGEIMLIDWKRSEKLPKKMKGYSKNERTPKQP